MARRLLSEKTDNQFQFRMEPDLLIRYMDILKRAERRNPHLSEADVNRILAGVDPPDAFVTQEDINAFRGKGAVRSTPVIRGKAEKKAVKGGKKRRANGTNGNED